MSSSTNQDIQSLSSINHFNLNEIETTTKMEVNADTNLLVSPYLSAIQSLNGQTPGEKYRQLNALAKTIVDTHKTKNTALQDIINSMNISESLLPHVRIIVGNDLQICEIVVEALKSSDPTVVNQALKAEWFFDGNNSFINVVYFELNILPYVSLSTRSKIVKVLSRGLRYTNQKAEDFFTKFSHSYGLKQALIFLPYCGEEFILNIITTYRTLLKVKTLDDIFQRHPDLIVNYLKSDKWKNEYYDIRSRWQIFFPKLIKNYPNEYYKIMKESVDSKTVYTSIGSTRISYLFKTMRNDIITKPENFIDKWPLKVFHYYLTIEEFEIMYSNLVTSNANQFYFLGMLQYLKYYPKEKRLTLMKNAYNSTPYKSFELFSKLIRMHSTIIYSNLKTFCDLLSIEDFEYIYSNIFPLKRYLFETDKMLDWLKYYPDEKKIDLLLKNVKINYDIDLFSEYELIKSHELLRLLSNEKREKIAENLVTNCLEKKQQCFEWFCYLSLEKSFKLYEKLAKSNSAHMRFASLKEMIKSCKIYNNQNHLLKVLQFYSNRCKNERTWVLYKFLSFLTDHLEIENMNDDNWFMFSKIIYDAYIKDELFNASRPTLNKIFDNSLHRFLIRLKENVVEEDIKIDFDKFMNIYLEYNIEYLKCEEEWEVLQSFPEFELDFFEKCIEIIAKKYPEENKIWKRYNIDILCKLINKLHRYNNRLVSSKKSKKLNNIETDPNNLIIFVNTKIQDYPWLMKTTIDILKTNTNEKSIDYFKNLIKEYDMEFYLSILPLKSYCDYEYNIRSSNAWLLLKNDQQKILDEWEEYLNSCRKLLRINSLSGARAARRFILSSRWYNTLPVKFAECCLREINEDGSLIILAILLESDAANKILLEHIPTGSVIAINNHSIMQQAKERYKILTSLPRAMNVTKSSIPQELLLPFFQHEYTKLAEISVFNFGQRNEKTKLLALAEVLINNSQISISKHGVRMVFQVASLEELKEFLIKIFNNTNRPTSSDISGIIAKKIYQLFIYQPCQTTWQLVEMCISQLESNHKIALKIFSTGSLVKSEYTPIYIMKFFDKIEELARNGNMNLKSKEKWIINLLGIINGEVIKYLPKMVIIEILRRYFFKAESKEISRATEIFAKSVFYKKCWIEPSTSLCINFHQIAI